MTEAMRMVRDNLGEDAIIVATREERGGSAVRVTAAIEPAFEIGRPGSAMADDWLQYDQEEDESPITEEITEIMLRHGVPEEVMDQILSCATIVGLETPGIALMAAIEHLFNFAPLPQGPSRKPLMMMGPPGSGKTLAVAKMAARATMGGLRVGVISTDTVRAGGLEQLAAFTKLLRIDLKKADTPQALKAVLGELSGCDQILIDTAGTNPFSQNDIKDLARLAGCADMQPYLVMPAGGDADECGEVARIFAAIGAHSLIPTRMDITRRFGGILAAVQAGGLSFADASNTPKVADGLVTLDPQSLTKLLMPGSYTREDHGSIRKTGTRQ
ncbi:MAG: GTPase [Alphaproteobacteria bacterium]